MQQLRRLLFALILVTAFPVANAQSDLSKGTTELGAWLGYSPNSPQLIGVTSDRQLWLLNLQYARVIGSTPNLALKYVFEIVPMALVRQPVETPLLSGGFLRDPNRHHTTYGGGANPIGFQLNLRRGHKLQPFFSTHGGFLYFAEQVPVLDSSQFNFTFSFGAGAQVFTSGRTSVSFGYKFHHVSNANTGFRNPGIDSNLFFVGFSRFRSR